MPTVSKPETVSVYCITHRDTGREYIGITTRRPAQRWSAHRCYAKQGTGSYIGRALVKYGPDAFDWKVIAGYPNAALAKMAERALIRDRKPEFNCTAGGDGTVNPTPESRQRMSKAAQGRVRSPETRERMSAAKLAMWADPAHRLLRAEKLLVRASQEGRIDLWP